MSTSAAPLSANRTNGSTSTTSNVNSNDVSPARGPAPAAVPTNGNHVVPPSLVGGQEPRPPPAPPAAAAPNNSKKAGGKAKKGHDSNEMPKLLAQRISQLEHDAAGEKDQEAEIGASSLLSLYISCRPRTTSRGCEGRMHQGICSAAARKGLVCLDVAAWQHVVALL